MINTLQNFSKNHIKLAIELGVILKTSMKTALYSILLLLFGFVSFANAQNFASIDALIDTCTGTWLVTDIKQNSSSYNPQQQEFFTFFTPNSAYPNDSSLNICFWDSSYIRFLLNSHIDTNLTSYNMKLYNVGPNQMLLTFYYTSPSDTAYLSKISDLPFAPYTTNYDTVYAYDTIMIIENVNLIDSTTFIDSSFIFDTVNLSYTIELYDTTIVIDSLNISDTIVVTDTIHIYDTIYSNIKQSIPSPLIQFYPTLCSDYLTCKISNNSVYRKEEKVELFIYNTIGELIDVRSFIINDSKTVLDLHAISSGKYFIQVKIRNQIIQQEPFVRL